MIRLLDGLPTNVIGFEATGEVDTSDYKSILDPAVDGVLAVHDKIRFLYLLGSDFTGFTAGAMWQDTKVGVSHWTKFERIAVVTDHVGYADGIKAFSWMVPGDIKVFALAELDEATNWVAE